MKWFLIFIVLTIPLLVSSYQLFILQDINDPIKYIYTITGASATVILFFTISISLMKDWINLMKYRKLIGLFGFFYALLHMINFTVLDAELDIGFIIKESLDKPFVYLGMSAFFILLFMAITSTKKLYKKYNKYHKGVYLALILITIHFIMAQKSLSILQLIYIAMIFIIAYCKLLQQIIRKNRL